MDLSELRSTEAPRHPWELARSAFFLDVLRDHGVLDQRSLRVLDVGAGDGYFAMQLNARLPDAEISIWDVRYDGEALRRLPEQGFT